MEMTALVSDSSTPKLLFEKVISVSSSKITTCAVLWSSSAAPMGFDNTTLNTSSGSWRLLSTSAIAMVLTTSFEPKVIVPEAPM